MTTDEKLSEVFGVEPMKNAEIIDKRGEVILAPSSTTDEALTYDYEKTRGNLHSLLNQGQEALFHALEVAKQSEHPRAFEVVGGLMKHLSDINHQLMDLHRKKQVIESPKEKEKPSTVTNNSIFVGSTHELSKMLDELKKGKT
jgi:hypothetical protein